MTGWWRALESVDIDLDGDLDLIAGNLGLNYKYKANQNHPFSIYASDFDENGSSDIVLSYKKNGKKLPLRGRECSSEQVPAIARRFKTYEAFAEATLGEIYGEHMLTTALQYNATIFGHVWLENDRGRFIRHLLPRLSQISSIESILPFDYNNDNYPDLMVAGNLYHAEVETTRNDASIGLVLVNDRKGGFQAVSPYESGLKVHGEVKAIQRINDAIGQVQYLFVRNNDTAEMWEKVH